MNFAITGVAGYIARRHLDAIRATGHAVVAAADPHDSVGLLDGYGFEIVYFKEIERFDRHLDRLRRGPEANRVQWLSICSPNYLHDAHIRIALRNGAHALCEKPLVISPWNLDALESLEGETGKRVFTVLQLRHHPKLLELKRTFSEAPATAKHEVVLTYVTSRGRWYDVSWKGSEDHSGGIATNIGIHFFDWLMWMFGPVEQSVVHMKQRSRMAGFLDLRHASVRWFLSLDKRDLPFDAQPGRKSTHRSIVIDGAEVDFTEGFTDLHTRVYESTLAGEGFGISDARPSVELAYRISTAEPEVSKGIQHPILARQAANP